MPNVTSIETAQLSTAHRKALQALKRPVMDAARQFGAIRERLQDIAPRVIKLFNSIVADHDNFTFVEFVRMFDPTVPQHAADRDGAAGYRNHRTYYTLDYMRRLVRQPRRGQQGVRDSAADALARTIATILSLPGVEPESVWNALQTEFGYQPRLMTRLRKRVEATQPLLKLNAPKPVKVGSVIHMEPLSSRGDENEPMAQPGRHIQLPAAPATSGRAKRAAA